MRQDSNAYISISNEAVDGNESERQFVLTGTQNQIQKAISLLYKKMESEKQRREERQSVNEQE